MTTTLVVVFSIGVIVFLLTLITGLNKGNKIVKREGVNKISPEDIDFFEETKDKSWIEVNAIINNKIDDYKDRENYKNCIKSLRKLTGIYN